MTELELLAAIAESLDAIEFLAGVGVFGVAAIAAGTTWRLCVLSKNQKHLFACLIGAGTALFPLLSQAQDTTSDLVHRWDLFEDAASDGGTSSAALTINGSVSVTGERATGFSDSNYLQMPSLAGLAGDSTYTISFWVNASSRASVKSAISWGGATSGVSRVFYPFESANSGARLWDGSALTLSAVGTPGLSADYHVAIVCESSSSAKLYVDGVLAASSSSNLTMPGGTPSGTVGRFHAGTGQAFHGTVGQVKVFSRALNASDVGALKVEDEIGLEAFRNPPDGPEGPGCSSPFCSTTWTIVGVSDSLVRFYPSTGGTPAAPVLGATRNGTEGGNCFVAYRNGVGPGWIDWESPSGVRYRWNVNGSDSTPWAKVFCLYCEDDRDGDGWCDIDDCDDDNDGTPDKDEDDDGDGTPNDEDDDDDDDGCLDNEDCEDDDEDGLANCEDPDDDNDGKSDHIDCDWYGEGGGCGGDPPEDEDLDDDGIDDIQDMDDDGDGIPDWIDLDDDNDGTPDDEDDDWSEDEEHDPPRDTDDDGIPDWQDDDDDGDDIPDIEDDDDDGDDIPDEEDEDYDECGNCNTDDNDCQNSEGKDCGSGPRPCSTLGDGVDDHWCCDAGSESDTEDNPCEGLPPCDETCEEEEPEEPGGEGCACCADLLAALEYNVPDNWKPDDETIIREVEEGLGREYGTSGDDQNGKDLAKEVKDEGFKKRIVYGDLVKQGVPETGDEDFDISEEDRLQQRLPGLDTITFPVPEIGAPPGNMEIVIAMKLPGHWNTSIGYGVLFNTLPLLNNASHPEMADLWAWLETLRLMLRPLSLASFLWAYWQKFWDLFKGLGG